MFIHHNSSSASPPCLAEIGQLYSLVGIIRVNRQSRKLFSIVANKDKQFLPLWEVD